MRPTVSKRPGNSTQIAPIEAKLDAKPAFRRLEARVAVLEARNKRIEQEINRLAARFAENGFEQLGLSMKVGEAPPAKRGPKQRHSFAIVQDRDDYVRLLEQYWPEIEPLCGAKPNRNSLKLLFSALAVPELGPLGDTAKKLLERIAFVEEFLTNPKLRRRFNGDPRVLAGALAGVPQIGLWRSLKLCPPRSCKVPIHDRTMRSYLRRKHPALERALLAGLDLPQLAAWMREYRTRDRFLREYQAVDLLRAWGQGHAFPSHLGITSRR